MEDSSQDGRRDGWQQEQVWRCKGRWAYVRGEDHGKAPVGLMLQPHGPQQLHIGSIHVPEVGYGGAVGQLLQGALRFAPLSGMASNAIFQQQASGSSTSALCSQQPECKLTVCLCPRITILGILPH